MKQSILFTLAFVIHKNKILLGYKKRGLLKGKWNGFGGKVELNETIRAAASRELEEECGLKAIELYENGLLTIEFENQPVVAEIYLFTVTKYTGTIKESNEMIPKWFQINDIPFEGMCHDDKYWLPSLVKGEKLNAYFLYNENNVILAHNVKVGTS